jgi:hypothetical protein
MNSKLEQEAQASQVSAQDFVNNNQQTANEVSREAERLANQYMEEAQDSAKTTVEPAARAVRAWTRYLDASIADDYNGRRTYRRRTETNAREVSQELESLGEKLASQFETAA